MKKPSIFSAVAVGLLCCLPVGCGSSKTSNNEPSNTNSGGGASVTPLAVTGVSPSTIVAGTQTTLTITGTGFSASSVVQVNGIALATTFVSSTQLTAVVAAGQLSATSSISVSVVDKGVTAVSASAVIEVDNPKPAISNISPSSALLGSGATDVTVTGTNFLNSTVVQINGVSRTTKYSSSSQLAVTLTPQDLSSAGTLSVTASSPAPGGGASNAVAFAINNPAPVLSTISPSTLYKSSAGTKVTMLGTGFQPTSAVLLNGNALATAFLDSTKLSVTIGPSDLPQAASATLQVVTPAPGGGSSAVQTIAISNLTLPVITGVTASLSSTNTICQQIALNITGTNLLVPSPLVKINGTSIGPQTYLMTNTLFRALIPTNLVVGANPQITIESQVLPDLISVPFTITSSAGAVCIGAPYNPVVYPGTSFALDTYISSINLPAGPIISGFGLLPSGFNVVSAGPYNPPTRIIFSVDANTAAGSYSITPQLQGAPAMTLPVTVSTTKPTLYFVNPLNNEIALPIGGSVSFSAQLMASNTSSDLVVDVGMQGLPPGVSAKVRPSPSIAGDQITITLTADKTAASAQNLPVSIVGTVSGLGLSASSALSLNVYQGPGTISNNRTTFTPTGATPSSVVFDHVHNLVFASNPVWNRIDVISNQTHKIVRSIPVPSPAGIDLSQDSQTLWIATKSKQVYALDTAAFTMRRYTLPGSSLTLLAWASNQIFALSNGDIFLTKYQDNAAVVWTPSTGAINFISTFADSVLRSGDGTKVFGLITATVNGCAVKAYSATQGMQTYTLDPGSTGFCGTLQTSNRDGSMLIGNFNGTSVKGVQLIDGTAQVLGSFTPVLTRGYLSTQETTTFSPTAFHFSPDETLLYQTGVLTSNTNRSLLATYDVASRKLLGVAPAISSSVPPLSSGYGGPSILVDVDSTGMLIGIQSYGVAFEDATYFQNVGSTSQYLTSRTPSSFAPQAGPLSGGTTFGIDGYSNILPDVWFGDIRGKVSSSAGSMSLTSPAASDPGPVDLKLIYPNGMMGYTAQGFSYGPTVQNMVYSGASPSGGANATLTGFGLPADSSGGSVSIGGSAATITSVVGQYPAWVGESVPSTYLKFTVPAGTPGYADVQVQTPNGSSTLPRGMFYASSVNSYAFDGAATSVIYDKSRNHAYVVTKTKVLVFDAGSGSYLSPIVPPTVNSVLDLYDAAVSVDGNSLVVTNRGDASVAVVDLTTGSSYVVSTPYVAQPVYGTCALGPGPVAALAGNKALVIPVTTNSNCYTAYYGAIMDLQAHSASSLSLGYSGVGWNTYLAQLQSTADGSLALVTMPSSGASYSPVSGFGALLKPVGGFWNAISGDGNIMSADLQLVDATGSAIGTVAQPPALYQVPLTGGYPAAAATAQLRGAVFNAAGGLYFLPHAGYFEVIDTVSASLRIRFSLTQTVQDIQRPIAIDDGGKKVFLVTNEGLTVVDMGQAPLSIGHLGTTSPVSGGIIQVRGSGFDASTTATVDSMSATTSFVDENTINVGLPALTTGPHDLTFKRNDGSSVTAQTLIQIP